MCMIVGSATEVETLKSALAEAKEESKASKAGADKATADLKAEQATRRQCKERISVMERELEDATGKCKLLEEGNKAKAA